MRGIITIVALVCAVAASGQIYIDSYRFGGAQLLLDEYPGAAAAYSLRKLRTAYTGNAIMVRRSSDGDSLNIGFSGNYLDTTAMKTFCGTGATDSCWVRTWFDQSENARNATQTTSANQPRIMTSGLLTYEGNEPTLIFSTSSLVANGIASAVTATDNPIQVFAVAKAATSGFQTIFSLGGPNAAVFWVTRFNSADFEIVKRDDASALRQNANNTSNSGGLLSVWSTLDSGTALTSARNGSIVDNGVSFDNGARTFTLATIGVLISNSGSTIADYLNGRLSEIIIYPSDQTSNRTDIETNINNFYSIY
jgi:hypothetical protein